MPFELNLRNSFLSVFSAQDVSPSLLADLETSGLFEQQKYWQENCLCSLMNIRM